MDVGNVIELSKEALNLVIWLSLPMLAVSLVIGIVISLFQAVTQIQEMTLTFVPKIIAVFITTAIAAPWLTETMISFTRHLFQGIPAMIH